MVAYVFPGQGSQFKGMGASLFSEFPEYTQKAEQILGYSIEKLCMEAPNQQLNSTDFTQPAIYTVSVLSYLKKLKDTGVKPNYVAGHSLGEYNALFAAEVIDFEEGLRLVQKRGALMSQATGGGMSAIIGLTGDQIQTILKTNQLNNITIANYNTNKQIIISGTKAEIVNAEPYFIDAGAMLCMPLNVSGAFHSPLMENAAHEFADFIRDINFATPKIQVIANISAKPYKMDEVRQNLVNQITNSVQWYQTVQYLLACGEAIEEIGPGRVLTDLLAKIQKGQ